MRFIASLIVLSVVFSIAGCTNWEAQTFQTIGAANRLIAKAGSMYNDGTIARTQANHDLIARAIQVNNLAAKAFADYWDLKMQLQDDVKAGTLSQADATTKLNTARDLVTAALKDIPALVVQVQQLIKPPAQQIEGPVLNKN